MASRHYGFALDSGLPCEQRFILWFLCDAATDDGLVVTLGTKLATQSGLGLQDVRDVMLSLSVGKWIVGCARREVVGDVRFRCQLNLSRPKDEQQALNLQPERRSPSTKVMIGDYEPGEHEKEKAITYWKKAGRDDLCEMLDDQIFRFRASHKARGTMMLDWNSAWQTWYCNAVTMTRPPAKQPGPITYEYDHCSDEEFRRRCQGFLKAKQTNPEAQCWPTRWGGTGPGTDPRHPKAVLKDLGLIPPATPH